MWLYYKATEPVSGTQMVQAGDKQFRSLRWTEMGSSIVRVKDTAKRQAEEFYGTTAFGGSLLKEQGRG